MMMIKEIAAVAEPNSRCVLVFALAEDGTLWVSTGLPRDWTAGQPAWKAVPGPDKTSKAG